MSTEYRPTSFYCGTCHQALDFMSRGGRFRIGERWYGGDEEVAER